MPVTVAPEDLSSDYSQSVSARSQSGDVAEMQQALQDYQKGDTSTVQPAPAPAADPAARPLPEAKPLHRDTTDTVGRIPPTPADKKSGVMRNAAEVPGAVVGGLESGIEHAMGWAIDPLANWLNEHVADLSYKRDDPQTVTGSVTKDLSEFLVGFVPALKGLRAVGMTGKVAAPILAGAISSFATQDPASGRLSDIWVKAGLPKNALTDYLSSKPDDTGAEARFKNAVESGFTGIAAEGVFLGARALRAARSVKGVAEDENAYLKAKYGAVTDEDISKVVGDPKLPTVETVSSDEIAAKLKQGAADTEKLAPRSVIRTQFRSRAKTTEELMADAGVNPKDIGPHEGNEIAMMEAGDKPAYFGLPSKELDAAAEKNGWTKINLDGGAVTYGVTEDAANAVKAAHEMEKGPARYAALGKSLGYTDPQIASFQKWSDYVDAGYPKGRAVGKVGANSGDFSTYINFAKFDEPDQVKFAIGKMAEAAQGTINEARRGVITHQETEKLAGDLGMSVEDLLARRKGQPLNAEEAVAARQLWASSAERLLETAKAAADKNAGPLDQFAFRRMMAVHAAIQSEVIGARTETARALSSWNIPVKGDIARARAIDQIMQATGGTDTSQEMARRMAILGEVGADPAAIGNFAQKGYGAATMDAIKEAWVNGLLSNPKTHVVNMFSNTLVAAAAIAERQAAGVIRAFTGGEGVAMGEAAASAYGLISGIRDAFRYAAKAVETGETSWTFNKVDMPAHNAISADAFQISKETGLGRFVDFLGNAARVPTHLMGAEDEWFKSVGYRAELHAQSLRQALSEGNTGYALGQRMAELVRDPPEHIMINSADAALYNTFTNQVGALGQAMMNLRNSGGPWNPTFLILPFVRTPVNIARFAFERSPFAPLVSQWRADIAAGGARADLALARISTGTATMLTAMDFADKGIVTGPMRTGANKEHTPNEALQRQGVKPYSIKVGDNWYSYNRADPFGMTMGFAASIAEAVKKGELDNDAVDEWQEVTAMAIAAVSQVAVNKTYLQGFANFVDVMSDPNKYSQQYIDNLFASFLPATSLSSGVKNVVDPIQREVNSPREAVEARIAGLSDKLTPRRDLWGKPITSASGEGKLYDFLTPVQVSHEEPSPIDKEIVRIGGGPERITKQTPFDGVQANLRFYPKVYDDYTRLAGNDLKHPAWGVGAKDFLNSVVSGQHPMSAIYNTMSDESRKAFIGSTVQDYRKLAQQQILGDPKNSAFAAEIAKLKELHQQQQMPMMQ